MSWDGVGEVRYRRKGGHGTPGLSGRDVETFDPAEFLARVIMHISESRRHLVRYYGWYSNVLRGKRRRDEEGVPELNESPGKGEDGPDARAMRRAWAQLIRRIYEVDPLACPKCGAEMKVIAFITEHEVVDKILRHLRRRGEPGRGREPPGTEGFAAAS